MSTKKDNSTYRQKVADRRMALELLGMPMRVSSRAAMIDLNELAEPDPTTEPIILETHGGYGRLFLECYRHVRRGVVFEIDEKKSGALAEQRPTWAVYQADCIRAIRSGAGAHLPVNLLDVDPYGEPWPVLDAFFASERPRPEKLVVVVNDGGRKNVGYGNAWKSESLDDVVNQYGNDLFDKYLEICQVIIEKLAAQAGYSLDRFSGYYCGKSSAMTHCVAMFKRPSPSEDRP